MGDIINDAPTEQPNEERPAGAPEGAVASDPTTDEVTSLYNDLGIKAPIPTGAAKGRPKSTKVRAEDDKKKPAGNSDSGKKEEDADDKGKSKDAPASDKDVDTGDKTDAKGAKVSKDSTEVSDESKEADAGVRKTESRSEEDSKRGREEDPELGAERTGQEEHDKGAASEEEDTDEEGVKRPGKSNPAVEQRFQKLTAELKARDELIEKQAKELEETQRKQFESKVAQEDPEYTIDDFRKVRDESGAVLELDENQAELAWRRWQDGYNQRKSEREAQFNHEAAVKQYQQEAADNLMKSSVEAYDTLTGILDSYPELNSTSEEFDEELSSIVMPLIHDTIIYQEGTEPGNEEGVKSVIVGMHMNPTKILEAINRIKTSKRSLPLNGVNDNVEVRSNVNVQHGRSSDPTVNAANQLYKELNISKRL